MRLVFGLVLLVGMGLAGFAVYFAKQYMGQQQQQLDEAVAANAAAVKTVPIFVAMRPLKYGERMTLEDVTLIPYAEAFLPEGVFKSQAELFPNEGEKFRTVLRAMETNEAIMAVKVTDQGENAGVAAQLGEGLRAFAISVDVNSGVSGFLRPGDKVDVYWTGESVTGAGRITKLIDTNINIIAVDQTANGDTSGAILARTVTVAVTSEQVGKLAQAQSTGSLTLALVGTDDTSVAEATDVDQKSLLGVVEEAPVVAAPVVEEKVCTVTSLKGGVEEVKVVECPEEN